MAFLNRVRVAAAVGLLANTPLVCARVAAQAPLEAEVKAVFLFNFAKYVDLPSATPGGSQPIRMCVPANAGFLAVLREAVRDEVVNGRPLTASGLDGLDAARGCDILYVGDAASPDAAAWIEAVRGRRILTVGDGKLVDGLVIAFVRDQNRVRFDISRTAASKQSLSISSRLLGLARRVDQP
jgi:hypothetical protein